MSPSPLLRTAPVPPFHNNEGEISREAKCCQWYSRKAERLRVSPRVAGLKLRCLISYFLSCPRRPLRFSFQTTSVRDSSSNRKSQASPNLHCLNPKMSARKKKKSGCFQSWRGGVCGIKRGNYRKMKSCVFYTNMDQGKADYDKSELPVNSAGP